MNKEYPEEQVDKACDFYFNEKPAKAEKEPTDHSTRFVTTFHFQHKSNGKILNKHWNILQQDPISKPSSHWYLESPTVKPPTSKIKLPPSKLKNIHTNPNTTTLIPLTGMYQCKKALCKTCSFVQHGKKSFSQKEKHIH